MVKLAKGAKKGAKEAPPKKKAPPPPKEVEESSEEDSDEDEEEEQAPPPKAAAKKNATPAKSAKNGIPVAKQESEDDDEDDDESEEEPPAPKKAQSAKATPAKAAKATPAKGTPAKAKAAAAKKEESDDEDDDDDDESEEEVAPPPKKATPAKPAAKTPPAKAAKQESDEDEDDDEDDDDESEEEAPPKKATPAKPAAKATPAKGKAAKQEESEEEDEDDEDDESEEEEEMDTTPAPTKKTVKAKQEEEDDEDDDDEEDEDDDEEEEAPVTPGKRKADKKEKGTPPAKKAKSDGEVFSLFVGNLNSEKDFDELKEAIAKFFKKESLIIQDVRIGGSRKYGYADFGSEEDLQKALTLNGKKLMGLAVRLDRAQNKGDNEGKKDKDSRTLFVKNLPYSATQDELREIFDQAIDIRIPLNHQGSSRGIAYVEFKSEEIAEKVLAETQGSDFQGRSIMVDFTGSKSSRAPASRLPNKTLVVNNLAFSATEESLQNVFENAVAIRIPQSNNRPKGFAFVEFDNADSAKEALESFNNTEVEGRVIRLEYCQGPGQGGPTKTLFVKGLSDETTEQTLKDSFEGAIAARVATDKDTGSCKGYGFVDFESEETCKAAKEAMDDGEIDGNKVTLDFARPKGDGGRGGGRGGFGNRFGGGGFGGGRGGRGGFGGRGRGRGGGGGFGGRGFGRGGGGGGFGGRGGGRGGGFRGGRGGGGDGRPQGKKIKFDD